MKYLAWCLAFITAGLMAAETDNRMINPSFEQGKEGWNIHGGQIDEAVSRGGAGKSLRLDRPEANMKGQAIASQKIVLDQKEPAAFVYGCSSKAEGLLADAAPSHSLYGIELQVRFQDDSVKWISAQKKFSSGTHDWESIEDTYTPPRAIKEVTFYCRLRSQGKVWFDDFFLQSTRESNSMNLTGCSIQENGGEIILENDFVRLVFEPARGGTCQSFTVKSNGRQYTGEKHPNSRMFTDRFKIQGNCYNRIYTAEILKNSPNEVELQLMVSAPDGYQFLDLSKTIRLTKYSSAVEVNYQYLNRAESMADLFLEPYFRNGWNLQKSPEQRYWLPTSKGTKNYVNQGGDTHLNDVVAGWVGSGDGKGAGMVCEFDYSRLASMYFWLGGQDNTTAEWLFAPIKIAAGKTFATQLVFYPVSGLKNIENAENGIASAVVQEGERLQIDFVSARSYMLKCQVVMLHKDGSKTTETKHLQFQPELKISMPLTVDPAKLNSIQYSLFSGDNMVFETEHHFGSDYLVKPKQAKAKPAEIVPFSLELSTEVVTPHTKWAKPYSGGKPRALIIGDIRNAREIVELAQRMDLEYRTIRISLNPNVCAWSMCDRYGAFSIADANLSLKEELKTRFDVIVVSGRLWKHFEPANTTAILEQLNKGSGLILIQPSELPKEIAVGKETDQTYITRNLPLELVPHQIRPAKAPIVAAGENDRYRSVILNYYAEEGLTPIIPYGTPEPPHRYQDYSLSLLGRSLLWAAKKDSPVALENLKIDPQGISFHIKGSEDWSGASAHVILSNPVLGYRMEKDVKLTGNPPFAIPLPGEVLPGDNICDVIVSGPKGVWDWGSVEVAVPKTTSLTALKLERDVVKPGEEIRGSVRCSGMTNHRVVMELSDGFDRVIDRMEKAAGGEVDFALKVMEPATGKLFVTAKLYEGEKLIDLKQDEVLTPRRPEADSLPFAVGMGRYRYNVRRYLNPYEFAGYREAGANELRYWISSSDATFKEHLRYGFPCDFPLVSHHLWKFNEEFAEPYAKTKDKRYLQRKPCLNDPEFLTKYRKDIKERLERLSKYSPVSYDVGDENSLTKWGISFDFCFAEPTLKAFREWLKKNYGDLSALNNEWGTKFVNWDEVTPDTTLEIKERAASSRCYAAWADHRRFMELTFCGAIQTVKDVMKENGQDLPLDMSGTQPPNGYTGMDMWLISKSIDMPAAYDTDNLAEIIRSFGRPLIKPWYGYGNEGKRVTCRVWFDAFRFKNYGISYYTDNNLLYPDYTLPRQVRDLLRDIHDLREGGAALLKNLDDTPEVLIHYSQHSVHAAVIENRYADFLAARALWCKLLDDMNIHYRFVAYEEIENGELERNKAKILILPHSFAMSGKEADAIRRFVQNGGLLVGDRHAGIMNEHCTLLAKGMLDDVFGLPQPDQDGSVNSEFAIGDAKILAAAGKVTGPNPQLADSAIFVNKVGQGKAVFMNHHWPQYLNLRLMAGKNAGANAYRHLIGQIFKPFRTAGDVSFPEGDLTYTRTFVYDEGRFIGMVREFDAPGSDSTIDVELTRPAFVYDLRKKSALGKCQRFQAKLANSEAAFYAALPYEIENIKLTGSQTVKPGEKAEFTVSIVKKGDGVCGHPFKVEVFDASGQYVRLYSKTVYGQDGNATVNFRTALNDPAGQWRIKATDFISGKSAETTFQIPR